MAIASPEMALLLDRGLLKRCSHHDIDSEDPRRIGAGDTLDYNSDTIHYNNGERRSGSSRVVGGRPDWEM
jgi:hypothetical protein